MEILPLLNLELMRAQLLLDEANSRATPHDFGHADAIKQSVYETQHLRHAPRIEIVARRIAHIGRDTVDDCVEFMRSITMPLK